MMTKQGVLLFLLPLILIAACTSRSYVRFVGSGNIAEPTCWVRVVSSYQDYVYFSMDKFFLLYGYVFNIPLDTGDMFSIADVQVVAYMKANDGYWFLVDMTGYRTAHIFKTDVPPFSSQREISTGQFWVNERNVVMDESIFTNGCMSLIQAGEFEALGISRSDYCEVKIKHDETALRVGAGDNRSIRLYAEQDATYPALASTYVENQVWYQVDVGSGNLLWVKAIEVDTKDLFGYEFYKETRDPDEDPDIVKAKKSKDEAKKICSSLPNVDPPPIIQGSSNQIFAIEESEDCTSFNILYPIGTVPEGESTYRWSPVDEADQYVLNFSDYQGNYVSSIVVDGSQSSVVINTGSLATGSQLSFDIVAMSNYEVLCRIDSGLLTRTAAFVAPDTVAPEPSKEPTKEKKGGGGYTPPDT